MDYSRTRRQYTKEFKEEAVQLVVTQGKASKEVADNLGVNANVLRRWIREYREDPLFSFSGNGNLK
ncbi:MAG: transposase, partial [bacterium]|nr:transposase [bacterium]